MGCRVLAVLQAASYLLKYSGQLNVENIDVFCEKGVFEIEDSRKIMEVTSSCHISKFFFGEGGHGLWLIILHDQAINENI